MQRTPTLAIIACVLLALSSGCKEAERLVDRAKEKVTGKKTAAVAPKPAEPPRKSIESGTIALLIAAEGYQDEELKTARTTFVGAGFDVQIVSFFGGRAIGALGGETAVDKQLEDVLESVEDYVAVVLIGGPGATFYHQGKKAHQLVMAVVHSSSAPTLCTVCATGRWGPRSGGSDQTPLQNGSSGRWLTCGLQTGRAECNRAAPEGTARL